MSADVNKVFKTGTGAKVIMGLVAAVFAFIGAAVASGRVTLPMVLGIGLAVGFMVGQKVTLSDAELAFKQGFKTLKFPFEGTTFRVQKRTGLSSYFNSFAPESYLLLVTAPGKKERKLNLMLSMQDSQTLLDALRQKVTVTEA